MILLEMCSIKCDIDMDPQEQTDIVRVRQMLDRKSVFQMVDSSESADWNKVRNTLTWKALPSGGIGWRDGRANNAEPMVDRASAARLRDVYGLETKAREPAAPVAARSPPCRCPPSRF